MHTLIIKPEDLFQALADPIRLRLVRLMLDTGEDICLCEFVDSLQEPQYKLSRHVKTLRQAGLLSAEKDGRWVYHKIVEQPLLRLLYDFVQAIPDGDLSFASDLKRFKSRLCLRKKGRCQVGVQTPHLADTTECMVPQKSVASVSISGGDGDGQRH